MGGSPGEARAQFFAASGFPADGGYDEPWQEAEFGPVPYVVPNPKLRADALRVHDLHHPLTGYRADWRGEAEISAWELGSGGGGRYAYAWFIALFGLLTGLLALPAATYRAFIRGRFSRNLYKERAPARRLAQSLAEVRRELRLDRPPPGARASDRIAFVAWSAAAGVLALVFAVGIPFLVTAAMVRRLTYCTACPLTCP